MAQRLPPGPEAPGRAARFVYRAALPRHAKLNMPRFPWATALLLSVIGIALGFMVVMAAAQGPRLSCGPYKEMKKTLEEQFQEFEVGSGLTGEQSALALFATEQGETWTIISRGTDGSACVVSTGKYWSQRRLPVPGERES